MEPVGSNLATNGMQQSDMSQVSSIGWAQHYLRLQFTSSAWSMNSSADVMGTGHGRSGQDVGNLGEIRNFTVHTPGRSRPSHVASKGFNALPTASASKLQATLTLSSHADILQRLIGDITTDQTCCDVSYAVTEAVSRYAPFGRPMAGACRWLDNETCKGHSLPKDASIFRFGKRSACAHADDDRQSHLGLCSQGCCRLMTVKELQDLA